MAGKHSEDERPVTGEVSGEVTGTVTGTVAPEDPLREAESQEAQSAREAGELRQAGLRPVNEDEDGEPVPVDENGLPLTQEERDDLAKPVAAVPPGVNMDDIEPADGFRLPRNQNEAEQARQLAELDAQDASRPETAQQLADDARAEADAAAERAEKMQARADEAKDSYDGPDRPPLTEGWRYVKPEPDVHDPVQ